jgi:hypothetical protein
MGLLSGVSKRLRKKHDYLRPEAPIWIRSVIPAKAGIHSGGAWIPAFAGMTERKFGDDEIW